MDKSEENRMEKNKNSGSALARKMAVSLVCGLAAGFALSLIHIYWKRCWKRSSPGGCPTKKQNFWPLRPNFLRLDKRKKLR